MSTKPTGSQRPGREDDSAYQAALREADELATQFNPEGETTKVVPPPKVKPELPPDPDILAEASRLAEKLEK